jgi:hypothetical protein
VTTAAEVPGSWDVTTLGDPRSAHACCSQELGEGERDE